MTNQTTPATNVAIPQATTATDFTKSQSTHLLRLAQVLERIPVSRSHWWAGVASGKYPAAIKLSERVTVWKSADIQSLIESL